MQSSGSTRSSSDGSKRRPCCPPQRPPPCCSGPCLLQVRSTCARSMDGRRSQRSSAASRLTLPPDSILSSCRRSRRAKFQPHSGRHPSRGSWTLPVNGGNGRTSRVAKIIDLAPPRAPRLGELRLGLVRRGTEAVRRKVRHHDGPLIDHVQG